MPTTHPRLGSSLLLCLALSGCTQGERIAAPVAASDTQAAKVETREAETLTAEPRADHLPAPAHPKTGQAVRPSLPGPMLRIDEFKTMVFAVIDGVQRREDLTQANVERITGLKLKPISSERGVHDIAGPGADDWWRWNVNIATYSRNDTRLELFAGPYELDKFRNSRNCTYDFQEIHDRLKQMGFHEIRESGVRGYLQEWRYDRGGQIVRVSYYHSGEPDADAGRCVDAVRLTFAMTEEELRHGRSR